MDYFFSFFIIILLLLLLFTLFLICSCFFSMTVEMLVFQSDLLMLYVCGQSDSRSLIRSLMNTFAHTELYSHSRAYVEAHKASEASVNRCLPSTESCISKHNRGPNGRLIVVTMHL